MQTIDSTDESHAVGTASNLDKPMFDFPPTRHPKLNFFDYYPNSEETEKWHPMIEYLTETTLKPGLKITTARPYYA